MEPTISFLVFFIQFFSVNFSEERFVNTGSFKNNLSTSNMPVFVLEMAHLNPLWKYSVGWKSARVRAAWSLTSGVTLSRRVRESNNY